LIYIDNYTGTKSCTIMYKSPCANQYMSIGHRLANAGELVDLACLD